MNSYLPHVVFVALGIVVGGMLQHAEVANRQVGTYSSTAEVPVTMGNTAIGAAAGGIGAWLISMSGLFSRIVAIIGVAKKIKDAVPQSLIDKVSEMIKSRKVDLTALFEEFKQVDPAAIMALVKELVSLIGAKTVMSGDPALMKSVQAQSDQVIIEII